MEKGTIELTKEEAQVLMNLINIAVKTVGLEGAESGVFFAKKINEAFTKKNNFEKQTEMPTL